ncbi:MAG: iron ABC transporter permease [Dissulfurispiraceae bacterium]|nr:iron ABC transporter permease [Dissulfurispiraceae bacterium]
MSRITIPLLAFILISSVLISLSLGRYPVSLHEIIMFFGNKFFGVSGLSPDKKALLENLLLNIRLPRILAAALIGAALATSGSAFQAMFINPLVSPGLLGVLAGASFGAVLGMMIAKSWIVVQMMTVFFGLVAVSVAVGIAKVYRINAAIMLILGGIISGAFFTSLVSVMKYAADPYKQLPEIVYWLMGNLSLVDRGTVLNVSIPICIGIIGLMFHTRQLNVLSMGEEEARSLGINVERVKLVVIFLATLICALTVMLGGMIGWVGLIIPHICRMIVGPNNVVLLPASALVGASYLIIVDNVSRLAFPFEIPIGIVTSLIGIPFFAFVLKNARRGWH